jgi:xanthine dehydrogenase accessory factor
VKRALLEAAVAAQREQRPVVLVRALDGARQFIVTAQGMSGDVDDLDPMLRDIARAALDVDGGRVAEVAGKRYFIQTLAASPRIVIVGGVHIAQALIPMAQRVGYQIHLVDPRSAFANTERFPEVDIDNRWPDEALEALALDRRTAVVTLSHDPKIDEPALRAALASDAFYIGALGSRDNHRKRLERLAAHGFDAKQLERIHGPIGLPLGGRSPAEIAVSTLAQIIQQRHATFG